MNEDFYTHLSPVTQFTDVVNPDVYEPLPDDWSIISSDVRDSTGAIRDGKYKEVNMAGASLIAAISNFFKPVTLPFVFGGDGSTIAIPTVDIDEINSILIYCKKAISEVYNLDLAIGCIPVMDIRNAGHKVSIAKYKLSEHVEQAIFWGDGTEYVEKMIKSDSWEIESTKSLAADFSGLECRWNEIPSKKDEVVAVIIKVMDDDDLNKSTLYKKVLDKIEDIYGNGTGYKPLETDQLRLTGNPTLLSTELKIRSYPKTIINYIKYWVKLYYMQLAGWILMRFNIDTSETDWSDYKKDFIQHADYRKFSDALRLVISGETKQRYELQEYLEELYTKGRLAYGLHPSPAAITTCYVTSYQHNHIHFIDGSDGGYTKASQNLKVRLSGLENKLQ